MSTKDRRGNSSGVGVALPVTPMLDMTFQLLFFFIATFHISAAEGQIPMKFPSDDGGNPVGIPMPPEKLKDPVKIMIFSEGGDIKSFDVTALAFSKNDIPDMKGLLKVLDAITNKDKVSVTLEVQDNLRYATLISLMDELHKAGFKDLRVTGKSKP